MARWPRTVASLCVMLGLPFPRRSREDRRSDRVGRPGSAAKGAIVCGRRAAELDGRYRCGSHHGAAPERASRRF